MRGDRGADDLEKGRKESRFDQSSRDAEEFTGDNESKRPGITGELWKGGLWSSLLGRGGVGGEMARWVSGLCCVWLGVVLRLSVLLSLLLLNVKFPSNCTNDWGIRSCLQLFTGIILG